MIRASVYPSNVKPIAPPTAVSVSGFRKVRPYDRVMKTSSSQPASHLHEKRYETGELVYYLCLGCVGYPGKS